MTVLPARLAHEPGTCHLPGPAVPPLPACCFPVDPCCRCLIPNAAATMTGIAAASFFSNACRFGGCGLHFESLSELIAHIEEIHIGEPLQPTPRHAPVPATSASSATRSGYASGLVTSCVLTTLLLGVVAVDVCGRPVMTFPGSSRLFVNVIEAPNTPTESSVLSVPSTRSSGIIAAHEARGPRKRPKLCRRAQEAATAPPLFIRTNATVYNYYLLVGGKKLTGAPVFLQASPLKKKKKG